MNNRILVLGAGTAGCAAAVFLQQHGFQSILVDRVKKPFRPDKPTIGESLSPDAAPLLRQLGIWDDFCKSPHLKCYANVSYWNSPIANHHDFLQHPVGHGWHLDRTVFDNQLLEKALLSGTEFHSASKLNIIDYQNDRWQTTMSSENVESTDLHVDFVIDATGKNSWFARKQGVNRLYEAEQLSLVNYLKIRPDYEDSRTLVETTADGWWYTAAIPGDHMVAAFFCTPEKADKTEWITEDGWRQLLYEAPRTVERIKEAGGIPLYHPRFVAAHSSILENLQGPGWVAIGEAALTYDPIAALGITMALTSARDATSAIGNYLKGDLQAMERYEAVLWAAFQSYAAERQRFQQVT